MTALAALLGSFSGRTGQTGFSALLRAVLLLAGLLFLPGFALVLLPGPLLPALAGRALALLGLLLDGLPGLFGGLGLLWLFLLLSAGLPAFRAAAFPAAGTGRPLLLLRLGRGGGLLHN